MFGSYAAQFQCDDIVKELCCLTPDKCMVEDVDEQSLSCEHSYSGLECRTHLNCSRR